MKVRAHAIAAVALVTVAVAFYAPAFSNGHGWALDDFKTFYCSGRALLDGKDPYAAAPLAACESQPAPRPVFVAKPGFVLPAPLPGYAIAAFTLPALLPFLAAAILWLALLLAATVESARLLSRLTGFSSWDVVAAFSIALVTISFAVGELVPLALFGIVLTAWAVREGQQSRHAPVLAGCGIALSFCEPQVGIAVAIACSLLSRRFAIAAAIAVALLATASIAALGIGENVAYIREVLPAHVAAELPAYFQYSFSWMLSRIGVAAGPALLAGRLQWIAMLALTAAFARSRFARERPEIAVLAAPAFAAAGGPFLHLDHVALVLPAALWIAAHLERAWWQTAAVVTLAVPLLHLFLLVRWLPLPVILAFIVVTAGWLGYVFGGGLTAGIGTAFTAIFVVSAVAVAFVIGGFGFALIAPVQSVAARMPQASWAHFVAAHYVMTAWPVWLVKTPTWFGLGATAAGLVRAAWGYRTGRVPSGAMQNAT